MFKKCPEFDDNSPRRKRDEITQMCEDEDIDDISTKIPVTYIPEQLTFRNKYCAECRGYHFDEVHSWNLQIVCTNSTFSLTEPLSMMDLYTRILVSEECNIFFSPQEYFPTLLSCDIYISACNVSGKWKTYNPVIETACHTYTAPYMKRYKNVFCYMCNVDEEDKYDCKDDFVKHVTGTRFSMVMRNDRFVENEDDFITDATAESGRCPSNAIYDKLQDICLPMMCQSPKIYLNGSCTNLASAVGGVGYKVFLLLQQTLRTNENVTVYAIEAYFESWLDHVGLGGHFNTSRIYVKRSNKGSSSSSVFGFYFAFYLPPDYPQNVSLIDNIHDLHDNVVKIKVNGISEIQEFHVRLEHVNMCPDPDSDISISTFDTNDDNIFSLLRTKTYQVITAIERGLNQSDLPFLLPTYNCPMITLDSKFYFMQHLEFGVKLDALSISLSKAEYMEKDGSLDVNVCRETFDMIQDGANGAGTTSYMQRSYYVMLILFHIHVCFHTFVY